MHFDLFSFRNVFSTIFIIPSPPYPEKKDKVKELEAIFPVNARF